MHVVKEGLMRKKTSKVNVWSERYFILRGPVLYYYLKATGSDYYSEHKGIFQLHSACKVSEIRSDKDNDTKRKQFIFRITWPADDDTNLNKELDSANQPVKSNNEIVDKTSNNNSNNNNNNNGDNNYYKDNTKDVPNNDNTFSKTKKYPLEKKKKHESKDSMSTGGKVAAVTIGGVVVGALTSGIGLIAGMVVVALGAAAGGSTLALNQVLGDSERYILLACDSYHEAEMWVHAIESQIQEIGDNLLDMPNLPNGHRLSISSRRHAPPPEVRLQEVEEWIRSSKWKMKTVFEGLRIYEHMYTLDDSNNLYNHVDGSRLSRFNLPPCARVNLSVNASASDVFLTIMNLPASCRTGTIKNMTVVETIDNYTDIIHMQLDALYLWPTWTSPRDFCLIRHWKHNADGSYAITLDSTFHHSCPIVYGFVRATLHGAYIITPPKDDVYDEEQTECMLTFIAEMDPRGWIWQKFDYQYNMLQQLLLHLYDIRDTADSERFVKAQFDPITEKRQQQRSLGTSDKVKSVENASLENATTESLAMTPPPTLSPDTWDEPDACTFKIRGPTYKTDNIKAPSAPSLFKLIAVDLFEVVETAFNIAAHPKNRVHQALARGDKTWVFVLNIMVPGPPNLSFVAYFEGNRSLIEADTEFGRIAKPFFDGNDDEFRNNRFKLIPKIIDGNWLIKTAVKDTPTLLGNKLKQYYYKGDNYFELDVDVASSSIARNVCGLAITYAKNIVVDMGLCLQGNEENELPEVIMAAVSCIKVDTSKAKKLDGK